MTDNTKKLDIIQRIVEALSSKSKPRATGGGSMEDNDEIIGSVPLHLRHLHNLLDELGDEVTEARTEFDDKRKRMMAVRSLFFDSLKTQVPEPKNASGLTILKNWDVAASFRSDDESGLYELDEMIGGLMAEMAGR
jgi:hypothetical protein